jgi:PPOX class probable F420-dependent enzyme
VDALAFLAERPIGVLATVSPDGTPHAVPVEVVVHDGRVWCWCEGTSVKAANVRRTGRAALVAYKGQAGALVRGPARLLGPDDPAYGPVTRAFLAKYRREETYGNDALVEITPERVSAWED